MINRQFFSVLSFLIFMFNCGNCKSQDSIISNVETREKCKCHSSSADNYIALENLEANKDWTIKESKTTVEKIEKITNWSKLASTMREFRRRKKNRTYSTEITKNGQYFYLKKIDGTKIVYQKDSYSGKESILFSPIDYKQELEIKHTIEYIKPSPNGKYIAIALSDSGREFSDIIVVNTENKVILPYTINNTLPASFFGVDWLPDSSGFLYLRFNTTDTNDKEIYKNTASVFYRLGDDPKDLNIIFSKMNNPELNISSDHFPIAEITPYSDKYMIGYVAHVGNYWDAYYAEIDELYKKDVTNINWKPLFKEEDKVLKRNSQFTNDNFTFISAKDASNNKIAISKISQIGDSLNSSTIVPEKNNEIIKELIVTKKGLLYSTIENAVKARLYFQTKNGADTEIELPIQAGSIDLYQNLSDHTKIWVYVSGWLSENKRYELDLKGFSFKEMPLYAQAEYPEFNDFVIEELEILSQDNELIPLSLVYNKNLIKDGTNPVLINGYGAYGDILDPYLSTRYLSWVNEGGIYAVAHVRGGGAKGDKWHKAGYKTKKSNTWKDLISCSEYLIKEKFTSPKNLAILGQSAGGIMVGRAITERPDLFSVAIIKSGLLNPYKLEFSGNKANIEEFGTIEIEEECKALLEMDPYLNINSKQEYPAVLVTVGMNDARVPPWMSAKFISKMRTHNLSEKPLLFSADYKGGHLSSTGKVDTHEEWGKIFSFAFWQTGHPDYQPKNK